MGIVWGKPESYNKSKGVSASAVRRIANEEFNARSKTRRNKPNRSNRSNNRRKEEKEEEKEEEEMPEEFKDAMRDAGLDPDDSADVKEFLKSLNQDGGKRRAKHKRK